MTTLRDLRRFQRIWFALMVQWFVRSHRDDNRRAIVFLQNQLRRRMKIDPSLRDFSG